MNIHLQLLLGAVAFLLGVTLVANQVLVRRHARQADARWDAGYLAGLRAAAMAADALPKPYITMHEERGWLSAHRAHVRRAEQLVTAELADQTPAAA